MFILNTFISEPFEWIIGPFGTFSLGPDLLLGLLSSMGFNDSFKIFLNSSIWNCKLSDLIFFNNFFWGGSELARSCRSYMRRPMALDVYFRFILSICFTLFSAKSDPIYIEVAGPLRSWITILKNLFRNSSWSFKFWTWCTCRELDIAMDDYGCILKFELEPRASPGPDGFESSRYYILFLDNGADRLSDWKIPSPASTISFYDLDVCVRFFD